MAGREEPSSGIAELAPGATVGLLEQEPELDAAKDVRGNVEDGVREMRDLLDRFNTISAQFAEPDADFDALLAEQAKVQEEIDRARRVDARRDARPRDGRAAPAGRRPRRDDALGRRAAARRALPAAPLLARPAAARRADEPPRRRVGRLARALPRRLQGHRRRVTHDRYFLDNVAGWILELDRGKRHPVPGQLLVLARAEAGAARDRGEDRSRRAAARSRASSSGCG